MIVYFRRYWCNCCEKGLMQNEFQAYSSVFILLDYMPYEVHTSDEIKEGLYACSYHHNRMKKQMQRTRSYLHTLIKKVTKYMEIRLRLD